MSDLGATTNLEKESLEAHVDLCAMRYKQLDTRLTVLEIKMDAVQKEIIEGSKSLKSTIINATFAMIGSLIGVIITILMKF